MRQTIVIVGAGFCGGRPMAVQGSGEILLSNAASIRRVLSASRALAREVELLGGD